MFKRKLFSYILVILFMISIVSLIKESIININKSVKEQEIIKKHLRHRIIDEINNQDNEKINGNTINLSNTYIAILEIPRLNLKKSIVNNDNNSLDNIKLINSNNYILVAHSGIGYNAHFNNLDQLKYNDEIYIYENNLKKIYKVTKIYEEDKKDYTTFNNLNNNQDLILVTCKGINKRLFINATFENSYYY